MVTPQASSMSVDIGNVLDEGPFGSVQTFVVVLAAMAIVMDGFDGQLIGFAIPSIIKEWGITRGAFAPAVAAGLLGMAIGSACAGLFADRFGRRMAVVGSVFLFGAATGTIGFVPDIVTIAALRCFAGLGIAGALPGSTEMTAEFTPARRRTLAVTATIVCYPLGGMIAGRFAASVLPAYGWRGLFRVGGLFPIAYSALLFFVLPESPRYLSRLPSRWPEWTRLLSRMDRPTAAHPVFVDAAEQRVEQHAGFGSLFDPGRARDTLAIWAAFFMCLLAVYSAFSWLPTLLASEGLSPAVAGSGLTAYNFGGVFGALICAVVITRFGSRWPIAICCAGAAATAYALQGVNVAQNTSLFIAGIGLHGLFVNAVQCSLYALCACVYPTLVRATGTASAAVITVGGANAYLTLLGSAMAVTLVAMMTLRRHIPSPVAVEGLSGHVAVSHRSRSAHPDAVQRVQKSGIASSSNGT